jgi:hypothetical protein
MTESETGPDLTLGIPLEQLLDARYWCRISSIHADRAAFVWSALRNTLFELCRLRGKVRLAAIRDRRGYGRQAPGGGVPEASRECVVSTEADGVDGAPTASRVPRWSLSSPI